MSPSQRSTFPFRLRSSTCCESYRLILASRTCSSLTTCLSSGISLIESESCITARLSKKPIRQISSLPRSTTTPNGSCLPSQSIIRLYELQRRPDTIDYLKDHRPPGKPRPHHPFLHKLLHTDESRFPHRGSNLGKHHRIRRVRGFRLPVLFGGIYVRVRAGPHRASDSAAHRSRYFTSGRRPRSIGPDQTQQHGQSRRRRCCLGSVGENARCLPVSCHRRIEAFRRCRHQHLHQVLGDRTSGGCVSCNRRRYITEQGQDQAI